MTKQEKIGKTNLMNCGMEATIINIKDNGKIDIKFKDGTIITDKYFYDFIHGRIKNPNCKTVCGVGCIGQGKYKTTQNGKQTQAGVAWYEMMKRCYGNQKEIKHPTYKDCTVCEEWHNFQNFAKWYYNNRWDNKLVLIPDKDILAHNYGISKIYSPDTCLLVDNRINNLFTKCDKSRGDLPIGVKKSYNKYGITLSIFDKTKNNHKKWINLGNFDTPNEAFEVYKKEKEKYIKQIAEEYKENYDSFPQKLYDAMYNYKIQIDD